MVKSGQEPPLHPHPGVYICRKRNIFSFSMHLRTGYFGEKRTKEHPAPPPWPNPRYAPGYGGGGVAPGYGGGVAPEYGGGGVISYNFLNVAATKKK